MAIVRVGGHSTVMTEGSRVLETISAAEWEGAQG